MATKKTLKKYQGVKGSSQTGKTKVDLSKDLSMSNNIQNFAKNPTAENALRAALVVNPLTQAARALAEAITRTGAALGNKTMQTQAAQRDSIYEANSNALSKQKKGGSIKKYKASTTTTKSKTRMAKKK